MTAIKTGKTCALVQYDPLNGLFAQVRDMRDRLVACAGQIRVPFSEKDYQADISAIRALLVQVKPSPAYIAARERSIGEVARHLASHDTLKYHLQYWKDQNIGEKITTMSMIARLQSEVQVIDNVKGLAPTFAHMNEPKDSSGRIVLGDHLHTEGIMLGASIGESARDVKKSRIRFNGHDDALPNLKTAAQGIEVACHEQQHEMQHALAAARAGNVFRASADSLTSAQCGASGEPLHHDARQFSVSLRSIIPHFIHSAYWDQLHEIDARYVGEQVAKRVTAHLEKDRILTQRARMMLEAFS